MPMSTPSGGKQESTMRPASRERDSRLLFCSARYLEPSDSLAWERCKPEPAISLVTLGAARSPSAALMMWSTWLCESVIDTSGSSESLPWELVGSVRAPLDARVRSVGALPIEVSVLG